MKQNLCVTLVGTDKPQLLYTITQIILEHECDIGTSRCVQLDDQCSLNFLITGKWNNLAKLETKLKAYANQEDLFAHISHCQAPEVTQTSLPYLVELVAANQPSIVHYLAKLFAKNSINIVEMRSRTYMSITGTEMYALVMRVFIPTDFNIADIRENLLLLCEDMNIDAVLEPERI